MKKGRSLASATLFLFLLALLLPAAVLAVWSFTLRWPWPGLLPRAFSTDQWGAFFSLSGGAFEIVGRSALLAGGVTVLSLLISLPAAKALALLSFPGKRIVEMLVLAPVLVPPISYAPGMHALFLRIGIADSFTGVLLSHLVPCLPYGIRILVNVFRALGENMEIQARVLGATPFRAFLHITLPLIAPGIASAGGLLFIVSLSQYLLTFFLGGGKIVTLSLALFPLVKSGERPAAAVWSIIFILVSLSFCLVLEKGVKRYSSSTETFFLS